jgi:2-polyprenyl-6-methoxyphenol hydroxylase-like FAD-dependent oxidoreductase
MDEAIDTRCCIAGGGPAGMMLAFLLARMGVEVVVLEKHGDFLRDFRGDTIHPSTLDVMYQLGLLDEFLRRPHQASELRAVQRRRSFPTRATQRLQLTIQNNIIRRVLGSAEPLSLPWPLKLLRRWPILRRIPARLVGVGFRPEHVRTPEVG